jgi:integrase
MSVGFRRLCRVYLSPLARELCSKAAEVATTETKENDTLRFPGVRRGTIFTAWSKTKEHLDELSGVTGWTHHDLRRTFSTRLNAFTPPHVVEKIINHASGTVSGVSAVYNRYEYQEERRAAVVEWEQRLLAIVLKPA